MTPDQWRDVKAILESALGLPVDAREEFLNRECRDDAMRREVRSLIEAHDGAGAFLNTDNEKTAALIARRIGSYEIESRLGAGGMGEVYLATDTRLGRKVAIKLLPRETGGSDDRVRRMTQEARAASTLNHPNIVTVHELGEIDGVPYIVQELVEGETLRQRMSRGALPLSDAIDIATQVASALAAAHAAGIVHRDIKPENIMLRRDGLVKVLDFGLAKMIDGASNDARTATGVILGTVSYMSPEQARREAVDARSDVWSLGVVLYEMLCGFRPFDGPSVSETLARILHNEPQVLSVPPAVERIVTKMLAKDRSLRYAGAGAVLQDLKSIPQVRPGRMRMLIPIVAAVILIVWMAETTFHRPSSVDKPVVPAPVAEQPKSVAVLPFANLSGGSETDYFSDGMTEEIINALARLGNLKVVSRTSVFVFKGKNSDIRDVAAKLGVTNVVEGSVRRAEKRLRVDARLINAADGYQLWSQTFDRELTDVFAIQSEIATAVADALRVRLGTTAIAAPSSTRNVDAYDAYLKGRQGSGDWTREGLEKSISYFRLATDRDPSFVEAWAALADAYSFMDHRPRASALAPEESYRLAEEAAKHALSLDPGSAEAHAALGHIYTHTGRFADAQQHSARAVELNPNSAMAHAWYATYLRTQRQFSAAKEHYVRARELDPYSALVAQLGVNLWTFGDYDGAAEFAQRAIDLDPEYGEFSGILARIRALQKRFREADEALRSAEKATKQSTYLDQDRAIVLSAEGRRAEAIALLRGVEQNKKPQALMMFRAYAAAGDLDSAARFLEVLVRKEPSFARVNLDLPDHPLFRGMLADPRYSEARRELGLRPAR